MDEDVSVPILRGVRGAGGATTRGLQDLHAVESPFSLDLPGQVPRRARRLRPVEEGSQV